MKFFLYESAPKPIDADPRPFGERPFCTREDMRAYLEVEIAKLCERLERLKRE